MARLTIIYDDDNMNEEQREQFTHDVRMLVHDTWGDVMSSTVIGPDPDPSTVASCSASSCASNYQR